MLQAANGEPIASSETYGSEAAAKAGVESVRRHAPDSVTDGQAVQSFKLGFGKKL